MELKDWIVKEIGHWKDLRTRASNDRDAVLCDSMVATLTSGLEQGGLSPPEAAKAKVAKAEHSAQAIRRSVASSTSVETGQPVAEIEAMLNGAKNDA